MEIADQRLFNAATALAAGLDTLSPNTSAPLADALLHSRNDLSALRYHLSTTNAPVTAFIGGTGTGKSTLVNRLLRQNICATSFRRTFTTGPIAILPEDIALPNTWLNLAHRPPDETPSRGSNDALTIVHLNTAPALAILDTPDIDGDHAAHIAIADRAFRWADRICFVVTPEKYQMTELLPYYRLAHRYHIPALFIMNKAEHAEAVEDFRAQLHQRDWPNATIYIVERDDATYAAPPEVSLDALRDQLLAPPTITPADRHAGHCQRASDIVGRVADQLLAPLRNQQRHIHRLRDALNALESPPPRVDVNPLTDQLQRRLQQGSILYLIGPGRVMDRVRQVPQLLLRLPRSFFDLARGRPITIPDPTDVPAAAAQPPDFESLLADQLRIVQSRIDDLLRGSPLSAWLDDPAYAYAAARIDPAEAGAIAAEELAALRQWLEQRWESNPRDTRFIMSLIKHLPGGRQLTKWSESAPYLLAVIVATHHAFFGHIDLLILGGYGLATWITERLSNEVSARTRATNRRITERFTILAHRQIQQTIRWLQAHSADEKTLARIESDLDALNHLCNSGGEN